MNLSYGDVIEAGKTYCINPELLTRFANISSRHAMFADKLKSKYFVVNRVVKSRNSDATDERLRVEVLLGNAEWANEYGKDYVSIYLKRDEMSCFILGHVDIKEKTSYYITNNKDRIAYRFGREFIQHVGIRPFYATAISHTGVTITNFFGQKKRFYSRISAELFSIEESMPVPVKIEIVR